ncbi:hypothetical protein COT42_05220 [Candidatus Saganbacteria bacterium CG08_land_8_20_14_0_20_45_16]|uniref:Uncharacterized protein n=1 Tax=Candidatus Saganbacteria bacterium CG08_land_8_20_14_0_20_45_16 TaxID=2014293 RepID=A0A2H0XX28_UNCSA|nr:MAG: hypothetical protein COT42_05220 [Candidatus Saganbacteria bacterium CG08_land_8_20_14_0_20_45_16]
MPKKNLFLLFSLLILFGCGRVVEIPAPTGGNETSPVQTDPIYIEDGITGGTFTSSDGNSSVAVPAGSIYAGLRANPTVAAATIDSGRMLAEGDTLASSAYELNLHSIDNFVTTNTVEVQLAFDTAAIPTDKLTSQYVYAEAYQP